ncbi:MAG: hypothetical protein WCR27_09825 [Eubacteriales bacterium]
MAKKKKKNNLSQNQNKNENQNQNQSQNQNQINDIENVKYEIAQEMGIPQERKKSKKKD